MKTIYDSLRRLNNHFVYSARYDTCADWSPSDRLSLHRLDPGVEAHSEPEAFRSIISRSENHLEVADWGYAHVGPTTLLALVYFTFGVVSLVAFISVAAGSDYLSTTMRFAGLCFGILIFVPSAVWGARPLYLQLTACTHYPIRLDRLNQTVHVLRDGRSKATLSIPWRDLTFGIGGGALQVGAVNRAICGYRERPDGTFDWFHLGVAHVEPTAVIRQWEYFRRFMEVGPQGLRVPSVLLGIDRKKESFATGAKNCWLSPGDDMAFNVIAATLTVPASMLRWVIMRFAYSPRWPDDVLSATPVACDDPYAETPAPGKDIDEATVWLVTLGVLLIDALACTAFFHFLHH